MCGGRQSSQSDAQTLRAVAPAENQLIALLPRRDRASLLAACEAVELERGTVLCSPGETTRHVYFPGDCVIALVTAVAGEPGLEVGMVGREGMLGAQLALGVIANPLYALVQGAGTARRVAPAPFSSRAVEQQGTAGVAQPLRVRADVATRHRRGVHALSQRGATPGALAPQDPGPHALRQSSSHPRVSRPDAGRAPRRHHRRRQRPAAPGSDPLSARRHHRARSRRAGGGGVQLLRSGPARL
jgi:hypothetical protein